MSFSRFAEIATQHAIEGSPHRKTAAKFDLRTVITTLQKDLGNAVRIKKNGWLCITNAHIAYSIRLHTQGDFYDGYIEMQIASDDQKRVTDGFESVKELLKQRQLKGVKIRPERGTGLLGGKRLSGLYIIRTILMPPGGTLAVLTEDFFEDELDPTSKKNWKGYTYSMTYSHWDEDALDAGDTDDRGWEVEESEVFSTLEELMDDSDVQGKAWQEWSSSTPGPGEYLRSDMEQDYRTGEHSEYAMWFHRVDGKPMTELEFNYINDYLGVR